MNFSTSLNLLIPQSKHNLLISYYTPNVLCEENMSDKSSMVTLRTFFMVAFMFLQPSAKNLKYATAFKLFVAKSFRLILPHALNDLISGAIIMQSVLFLTCSFKLCLFSFIISRECCVVMIFFFYTSLLLSKRLNRTLYTDICSG